MSSVFSSRKVVHESVEILLDSTTYFFGELYGHDIQINQGIHQYNFECQLPDNLPYTLDMKYGSVAYYTESVLENSFGPYKTVRRSFTIVRFDDLNVFPELRKVRNIERVVTFGFALWKSKPLVMSATISCTGFAVGQSVPVSINYKNDSNVEILRTKVTLLRRVVYTSHDPIAKKVEDEKIFVANAAGVKPGETKSFNVKFYIPLSMKSSNRRYCPIIAIDYAIEVIGEVNGYHKNLIILFPITIASLPLRNNQLLPDTRTPEITDTIHNPLNRDLSLQRQYSQQVSQTSNTSSTQSRDTTNVCVNQLRSDITPTFEEALSMPKPIR
ncbi:arrestin domain-containing protein 17-like isoform X2 [Chironomus tepperi]